MVAVGVVVVAVGVVVVVVDVVDVVVVVDTVDVVVVGVVVVGLVAVVDVVELAVSSAGSFEVVSSSGPVLNSAVTDSVSERTAAVKPPVSVDRKTIAATANTT